MFLTQGMQKSTLYCMAINSWSVTKGWRGLHSTFEDLRTAKSIPTLNRHHYPMQSTPQPHPPPWFSSRLFVTHIVLWQSLGYLGADPCLRLWCIPTHVRQESNRDVQVREYQWQVRPHFPCLEISHESRLKQESKACQGLEWISKPKDELLLQLCQNVPFSRGNNAFQLFQSNQDGLFKSAYDHTIVKYIYQSLFGDGVGHQPDRDLLDVFDVFQHDHDHGWRGHGAFECYWVLLALQDRQVGGMVNWCWGGRSQCNSRHNRGHDKPCHNYLGYLFTK